MQPSQSRLVHSNTVRGNLCHRKSNDRQALHSTRQDDVADGQSIAYRTMFVVKAQPESSPAQIDAIQTSREHDGQYTTQHDRNSECHGEWHSQRFGGGGSQFGSCC